MAGIGGLFSSLAGMVGLGGAGGGAGGLLGGAAGMGLQHLLEGVSGSPAAAMKDAGPTSVPAPGATGAPAGGGLFGAINPNVLGLGGGASPVDLEAGRMNLDRNFGSTTPGAPTTKPPGFWQRQNIPGADGLSTWDRVGKLGAIMQDYDDGGSRVAAMDKTLGDRAAKQAATTKQAQLAEQIKALYPNDPKMQFLLLSNPDKATEVLLKAYEPRTQKKGEVYIDPMSGTREALPDYGEAGGFGYTIDPRTGEMSWGDQRGPNYSEELGRDRLEWDQSYGNRKLGLDERDLADRSARGWASERRQGRAAGGGGGGLPAGAPPLPPGNWR